MTDEAQTEPQQTEFADPMDAFRAFVAHTKQKRTLKTEIEEHDAVLSRCEPIILKHFQTQGVQSVNISGMTVHMIRRLSAGAVPGQKETLCRSLEGNEDTKFLVAKSFNHQTLSSWMRELPRDESDMPIVPKRLVGKLKVSEVFKVGAKAS